MSFVSPYTVTVNSKAGGLAQCSFVDATGAKVPPNTVLTTTTPAGLPGSLQFRFVEADNLRLLGAAVKTVGNDPALHDYNYLYGNRQKSEDSKEWVDSVEVTWGTNMYTLRGVVLLFAQVDDEGRMLNFYPSADPQVRNEDADAA